MKNVLEMNMRELVDTSKLLIAGDKGLPSRDEKNPNVDEMNIGAPVQQ